MKLNKKSLWNFIFAVLLIAEMILPHSVVSLVLLFLFCIVSLFVYAFKFKLRFKLKAPEAITFYLLFIIVCILNIWFKYSISKSVSWAMITTLLKNLAFMICLSMYIAIIGIECFKKVFVNAAVCASVILFAYIIVSTGHVDFRNDSSVNANVLAMSDALAFLLLAADSQRTKSSKIVMMAILLITQILAGTRKAMLGLLVGLLLYVLFTSKRRLIENLVKIGLLILIAYIFIMKTDVGYQLLGNRIESLLSLFMGGETDSSAETRIDFIQLGQRYFLKSPIIGNGIDCFRVIPGAYGTYSHCNYIELLFGTGLLGVTVYYMPHLMILLSSLNKRYKCVNRDKLPFILIVVLLVFDIAWVSYFSRISLTVIVACHYMLTNYHKEELEDGDTRVAS